VRGLEDKVAVVTGAGSGIGRAIALRLADEGMKVAIVDLNAQAAAATADAIRTAGGIAHVEACDICDHAAVLRAVAGVEAALGPIHTLVNNAGWDTPMPFLKTTPDFWQKVVAINYMGPIHVTHAVVSLMVKRNVGRVIFIASDAGRVGSSGEVVYSGFTRVSSHFLRATMPLS
jgi:2-hydroxycyclohexanecarboxyl-CoA dehydrogenase